MRVAALQLGGCTEDLAHNQQAAHAALRRAARAGIGLAVLPELATVPYFCGEAPNARQGWSVALNSQLIRDMAACCGSLGIAALFPFYERGADGACHNSAVLIGANGTCMTGRGWFGASVAVRKLHLPRSAAADEAAHFIPGEDFTVFDLGELSVGCLICYDRRFPECWRAMRALGADMVMVPVAGVAGEDDAYVLGELRAHARQNGLAIVYAARTGMDRLNNVDVPHPGGSCVVGADGAVLAFCGNGHQPETAVASVSRADVARARAELPLFEQRHSLLARVAGAP